MSDGNMGIQTLIRKLFNNYFGTMRKKYRRIAVSGLLLFLTILPSYASWAQELRISLQMKDVAFVKVLEEIRKQSGYNFMYNEEYVKDLKPLTLDIRNCTLKVAMQEVLEGTGLQYKLQGNIIILQEQEVQQNQFRRLTGEVKDEQGAPIPGATVLIKGTTTGVSTDADGRFSLELPAGVHVLQISFIGMETQDVRVPADKDYLSVVMRHYVSELEEVIVSTGYTQTTRKRASGSVAVVNKEVFENKAIPTMDKLLQGQIAGVSVTAKSGRPGETAKIRIRGTSTLTGDAEPLWVVDGVPLQKNVPTISTDQIKAGDFSDIFTNGIGGINPNDIDNVTILKDAAAAAIYGSRAAGGVIVVTTKMGKPGRLSVNYSANISVVMKPSRDAGLMNAREKLAWEQELWDEFSASGYAAGGRYPVVGIVGMIRSGKEEFAGMSAAEQESYIQGLSEVNTDWMDLLFRTALSHNHYLSFSGGQEKVTYYVSLGYSKDNGAVKQTDYDRYSLSGKIDANPNERLHFQLGFDLAKQRSTGPAASVDPFEYAYFANPYEQPFNEDGSYRADYTYFKLSKNNGGFDPTIPPNGFNILREMNETKSRTDNISASARFQLDYTFFGKLKFSGLGSYSFTNNKGDSYLGAETYAAFVDRLYFDTQNNTKRTYGSISQSNANNSSYILRGQLSYSDVYNEMHRLSVIGGAEIRGEKAESIFEKRYGYDPVTGNSAMPVPQAPTGTNQINYSDIVSYADMVNQLSGESIVENRFASFYGAVDYSMFDRYVLNLSFRTDGSNNFGSDEQFNPTWSIGAAWHVSEENFMVGLRPVLDRLSLRVATGFTGNISKTVKPNLMMDYSKYFRTVGDESFRMGSIRNAPNPHLRWEKTRDVKVALDFGLWNERLSGLVEAYWRRSVDCVSSVTVPVTTGFYTQAYNTSEIQNNGVEASLRIAVLRAKDYGLNVSANVAWNQNKLKEYEAPSGSFLAGNYVGYPMESIFSGKYEGIDSETGLYSFALRPDAIIEKEVDLTNADNYYFYLGTNVAPVTGGFNVTGYYKEFSLSVGGSYAINSKIIDNIESPADYTLVEGNVVEQVPTSRNDLYVNHLNVRRDVVDRWKPERTTGVKYPRLIDAYGEKLGYDLTHPTVSTVTRGALVENVSYMKINSITLGYHLPSKVLDRMNFSSFAFSLALNNFFTITKYSGIDPEVPGATYPVSRSVTFGINVGF